MILLLLFGCNVNKRDYILKEKDLIPEGTAFNTETNMIYIGSIYKQKVIGITSKGKIRDMIGQESFGRLSPIGMEMNVSNKILWINMAAAPIVNQSNVKNWETAIMAFDIVNQKIKKTYTIEKRETRSFFNDITVATSGDVYATETMNGKIYKIDKNTDTLDIFIDLEKYTFPNGIVYYNPLNCLFVATNEGILKIELQNKMITLLNTTNIDTKGIDGLAIYDNYFIGHQSSKVSKFYFNEDISEITKVEVLDSGEEFDSSTTGEIGNGYYHFIVNSQIKSGINQKEKTIKPIDSLEKIIIRSIKL
ncbi:hypothetical protein [Aquimarina algiphila]|uniref:Gluconolaconase n=1 Tax=Aquimarina algiphila TaxID=2047982 RepID=A0A554VMX4_9FLAO|nr:hypothetical protein [Aquimarina algiphila]TSE09667.1 hypothetical protein FOF46_08125 [Aquimarina algiphila]